MRTFKEFQELTDTELGAVVREFLDSDEEARDRGYHSTSCKLAVSDGMMIKILTDDED